MLLLLCVLCGAERIKRVGRSSFFLSLRRIASLSPPITSRSAPFLNFLSRSPRAFRACPLLLLSPHASLTPPHERPHHARAVAGATLAGHGHAAAPHRPRQRRLACFQRQRQGPRARPLLGLAPGPRPLADALPRRRWGPLRRRLGLRGQHVRQPARLQRARQLAGHRRRQTDGGISISGGGISIGPRHLPASSRRPLPGPARARARQPHHAQHDGGLARRGAGGDGPQGEVE